MATKNLLGKSVIVFIAVVALVSMAFSVMVYATHKDWVAIINRPQQEVKPGEPLGLKHQLAEAKDKAQKLETTREALKSQLDNEWLSRRAQLAKLQSELAEIQKERDDLIKREASITQENRQALEQTQQAQKMLDVKIAEIDALREQMTKAYSDRDQGLDQLEKLIDEFNQAQNELERAKANNRQIRRQVGPNGEDSSRPN
jgi:chromosome segregation ATPase